MSANSQKRTLNNNRPVTTLKQIGELVVDVLVDRLVVHFLVSRFGREREWVDR